MVWLEVVGWAGSVLVVVSLMQARVWRFRVLNLVGSLLATAYNAVFGIWAFVAMNGAISLVNVYWLWRLRRERGDARVYAVVEVAPDDAYLRHVLAVHADDVARHRAVPARDVGPGDGDELAFLVVRGDETVGVVLVRDSGAAPVSCCSTGSRRASATSRRGSSCTGARTCSRPTGSTGSWCRRRRRARRRTWRGWGSGASRATRGSARWPPERRPAHAARR
ncbi:hypothetical protein [Cellulomonas shaoxiangyii]|uniref:hypothetical protein n=1 Tax=Cellulomonas shaoxiangyii TaxID=2566013 RepID=UPI0031345075